ncbi:MAG: hypothetical protein KJZ79_07875 [Bryobacteraceae bacterium]|nr:hypothetical protein [Bryobacteraceae bacterium]
MFGVVGVLLVWAAAPIGTYLVTLSVTGSQGLAIASAPVTVVVLVALLERTFRAWVHRKDTRR